MRGGGRWGWQISEDDLVGCVTVKLRDLLVGHQKVSFLCCFLGKVWEATDMPVSLDQIATNTSDCLAIAAEKVCVQSHTNVTARSCIQL